MSMYLKGQAAIFINLHPLSCWFIVTLSLVWCLYTYHSYGSSVWLLKLRFTVLPLLLILSHSWSSIKLLYFDDPLWPSCILQLWPLFVTFVHVWIHILSKHLAFFFLMTLTTLVPVHLKQTNQPTKKKTPKNLCNLDFIFFSNADCIFIELYSNLLSLVC